MRGSRRSASNRSVKSSRSASSPTCSWSWETRASSSAWACSPVESNCATGRLAVPDALRQRLAHRRAEEPAQGDGADNDHRDDRHQRHEFAEDVVGVQAGRHRRPVGASGSASGSWMSSILPRQSEPGVPGGSVDELLQPADSRRLSLGAHDPVRHLLAVPRRLGLEKGPGLPVGTKLPGQLGRRTPSRPARRNRARCGPRREPGRRPARSRSSGRPRSAVRRAPRSPDSRYCGASGASCGWSSCRRRSTGGGRRSTPRTAPRRAPRCRSRHDAPRASCSTGG